MAEGTKVPTKSEVWKMFRKIDMTQWHDNKYGEKTTYVPWARVWGIAMDLIGDHLEIRWHGMTDKDGVILDHIRYPDGTASVCCSALVGGEKYAECTLAVMASGHKPITNPQSTDLQNSRQRCQTKVLGMLGLGLYLWENNGEWEDDTPPKSTPKKKAAPKKKASAKKKAPAKEEYLRDEREGLEKEGNNVDLVTSEEASKELKEVVNDLWGRGWLPEGNFAKKIKSVVNNPDTVAPEEIYKLIETVKEAGTIALKLHDEKETQANA